MAVIGPIVFLALWPYLWNDTLARVQWYVEFHLNHEYYNIEYLGRNYFGPPSPKSYVPVMVLATVPAVTLAPLRRRGDRARRRGRAAIRAVGAECAGAARPDRARRAGGESLLGQPRDRLETDLLLFLSFAVAVGLFFFPKTPIFGGTKHWLPAYPVLALFAGRGFDRVTGAMGRALPRLERRRWLAAQAALFASVVLAPLGDHRALAPVRALDVRAARRAGRRAGRRWGSTGSSGGTRRRTRRPST